LRSKLAELLLTNIHREINRDVILKELASYGVGLREWAQEKTVTDRVCALCDSYTTLLKSGLINGTVLPLFEPDDVLSPEGAPKSTKILVVGTAGSGKSTALASLVDRFREKLVPVLPIRFDQLPGDILTTAELGRKLLLPESPTLVLAGIANGKPGVLVVDQLDTVSVASGRQPQLWALFDSLQRELHEFPNLALIVGCREFDLHHDQRLRTITAENSGFESLKLCQLTSDQIDSALKAAGTEPTSLHRGLLSMLSSAASLNVFDVNAYSPRQCSKSGGAV
jgi:hypothetical protein